MFDNDIASWIGTFITGFICGYLWFPAWNILKKIVSEARKATLKD